MGGKDKSRIIMIACVSPGKSSADHTLNTLRYAERLKDRPGSADVISNYMTKAPKESSDDSKLNFYQSEDLAMDSDEPDYSALDAAVGEEEKFNNTSPVLGDDPLIDGENNLFPDALGDENMVGVEQEAPYDPNEYKDQRKPLKNNFNNKAAAV